MTPRRGKQPLVQDTERVGRLGRRGPASELSHLGGGYDGVVLLAEDVLDVLGLGRQTGSLLSEDPRGCLRGVAGLLRGDPGLLQLMVGGLRPARLACLAIEATP